MRHFRGVQGPASLTAATVLLVATGAAAQQPAPETPAQPTPAPAQPPEQQPTAPAEPAPAEPAPAEPAPAEPAPAEPAAAQPPPQAAQPQEPAAAEPAPAAPVAEPAAPAAAGPAAAEPMGAPPPAAPAEDVEPPEEDDSPVSWSMFADAYYGFQTAEQGTAVPFHRAYAWNSTAPFETGGFTNENGFSLSFLGLDASYDTGEFAATGSLRFGPSVVLFHGNNSFLGIDNIMQAYVTWRPVESLELDLGQFGTIFGAEVAESWLNLNYSRGGLYYAMQPFWHTGLRGSYAFSDQFSLTAMVVDGTNIITEVQNPDNESPSVALQAGVTPNDMFSLAVGGMVAPAADTDGSGFDTFGDLVATVSAGDFTGILNADINVDREVDDMMGGTTDTLFYGASLALGYQFVPAFGAALRGEFLMDGDNVLYGAVQDDGTPADDVSVVTGTLTLDFKPIPDSSNLIIRWDNRIETSSEDIYFDRDVPTMTDSMTGETTFGPPNAGTWFGTVLGVVVTTDG